MKNNKSKYIQVKNEVPELLEALMNHDDCPEWLSMAIGDEINDRTYIGDDAAYFRFALNNIEENGRTVVHYPNRIAEPTELLDTEVVQ